MMLGSDFMGRKHVWETQPTAVVVLDSGFYGEELTEYWRNVEHMKLNVTLWEYLMKDN